MTEGNNYDLKNSSKMLQNDGSDNSPRNQGNSHGKIHILKSILISVFIIAAVFGSYQIGFYSGKKEIPSIFSATNITNKEDEGAFKEADFSIFWDAWKEVQEKYVGRENLDYQEMVYGAAKGMVGSLGDPYSDFFTVEENKKFSEDVKGSFSGVGMEIGMKDGTLTVIAPLKNTPAERAGLKAGDKILKIDSEVTVDMKVDEAVRLIRGPKGTEVVLSIFRNDGEFEDPKEIKIIRDTIIIPSINLEWKGEKKGIAYLQIYHYSENVMKEFDKSVNEILKSDANKLIIDLRNNPGGYLDAAIDMASYFLPRGELVVIEDYGNGLQNKHSSRGYGYLEDFTTVILINQGSASASEIFSGALSEKNKAILVGEKTFGKGSVQELIDLKNGTAMKLTIAKWLTPSGHSVSDEGIEPQIKVELTKENTADDADPQMEKAIEILSNVN